jgi:hypothetical protein
MKINQLILFFFMQLFVIGCKDEVPQDLIGVDPMAELIFDISLAEGYTESFLLKDTTLLKDSVYQSEINKVLQFHKITPTIFSKSYTYYTHKPVLFKQVMDSANARAQRYREEAINIESSRVKK